MQLYAFGKGAGFDLIASRNSPRVMKVAIVIILFFCLQASAKIFSQEITLSLNGATLEKVFQEVRKQGDYHFVYTKEQMELANKVTLEVKKENLETVLQLCFKDQPLAYTIDGNIVAISVKEKLSNNHDQPRLVTI